MKRILYTLIIAIAIIIVVCIAIACKNESALKSSSKETLQKISISEVTHSVFYAPQYVAINHGFFKEEGLDIDLITSSGADKVMTAVLSNDVQIGFAGPEAAIYIYNEGSKDYAQVFAQVTKRDGSFLVGRNEEENFSFENLKGKHVLPGRKGGVPYMTFQYVLRNHDIDTNTDLNFDSSISFDVMTGAFVGGTGDYVTVFEPSATILELEGKGHIVASIGAATSEIPFTAYFAKKSFIENNPEIIKKFVAALSKAQKWVQEHNELEIAEELLPSFPDTSIEILAKVAKRYKEIDAWCASPEMSKESFDRLQQVMIEAGELEKAAPFEVIVK